jgi:hypothetical protein
MPINYRLKTVSWGNEVLRVLWLSVLFVLTTEAGLAQSISEIALFNRCYAQLTGNPLPLAHALRTQVVSGKITALSACNQILDKASLGADGYLTLRSDADARAVLSNFAAFHRTWFSANVVEQIQDYSVETGRGTVDIYDSTEPSLALTKAMLGQGTRYADVLTATTGVKALREEDPAVRAQIGWTVNFPGRMTFGNNGLMDTNLFNFRAYSGAFLGDSDHPNSFLLNLPKIAVGELVGVRATTESVVIPNVALSPLGADRRGNEQPGLNFNFDIYKTFGGGVLGTPIYLMLNYGHGYATESNATTKVPRRWSQANMESFMCATLPALRETDARQFVIGGSSAPFRNSASCVMCHATLDPMAYTARNMVMGDSDYFVFSSGSRTDSKTSMHIVSYKQELPSVVGWPSEPVANFHRQVASGRLFFRSVTGALVDQPVTGIAALGAAMSNTDDFYQCAAKRYFEYFTGIVVPLYDRDDPRNAEVNKALSPDAIEDRKFIESLGTKLRSHQSIRQLVKDIMSSEYYKHLNYRP